VLADDRQPDTTAAARLGRDLQHAARDRDRVIAGDARLLVTQNEVEIGGAQRRHEGARRIARRPRKRGVVLGDELAGQIVIGRGQRRD
jgi:hypothetical protein